MPRIFDTRLFGHPCKVVACDPDWSRNPRIRLAWATDIQFGLGDRESRTARWAAPRLQLSQNYVLQGTELAEVRTLLATLGEMAAPHIAAGERVVITSTGSTDWQAMGAPTGAGIGTEFTASAVGAGTGRARLRDTAPLIAVPIWPAALLASEWAQRIWDPQAVLVIESGDVLTGTAADSLPSVPSGSTCVPLVLGRLGQRPDTTAILDTMAEFQLDLVEEGPWESRIGVRTVPGVAREVFPNIDADWSKVVEDSDDRLERDAIGVQRTPMLHGLAAPTRWVQESRFLLSASDAAAFLSHWVQNKGRWGAFDLPVLLRPHTAASPETPDGIRARYGKDEIELEWFTPALCRTQVRFIQVPWELNPPAGESPQQASTAIFYDVTYDLPAHAGGPLQWRFTSAERLLTVGDVQYSPAPIAYDKIVNGRGLTAAEVEIKTGRLTHPNGNPFAKLLLMEAECPIKVSIREGVVSADGSVSNVRQLFTGELVTATTDGKWITCTAGRAIKCRVPRVIIQADDNRHLFMDEIDPTPWGLEAVVVAIWDDQGAPRKLLINRTGGYNNPSADHYSGGWIEWGTGWSYRRRGVIWHALAADVGADITMVIDRPIKGLTSGQHIRVFPGYSGKWTQASRGDFLGGVARSNFFGFPYMPGPRPESTAPEDDAAGGAKKG